MVAVFLTVRPQPLPARAEMVTDVAPGGTRMSHRTRLPIRVHPDPDTPVTVMSEGTSSVIVAGTEASPSLRTVIV